MKKFTLVIFVLTILGCNSSPSYSLSNFCGEKPVRAVSNNYGNAFFLYFKAKKSPSVNTVKVTEADYEYYKDCNRVIDCK